MSDYLSKRKSCFRIIAIILFLTICFNIAKAKDITIVKNKKAFCRLVLPRKTQRVLRGSAQATKDLQEYIHKSSGAKVKIIRGDAPDDSLVNIHIGLTNYVKKINPKMPSPQGFVIQFPDEKNIIIAGQLIGSEELNTVSGVNYFLNKYIGVKWLFPLELGECVPKHDTISIPMNNIVKKPSFLRKDYSGLDKAYRSKKFRLGAYIWGIRQGYVSGLGLEFNHNVGNIIPPDKYTKTHPEFFPLINGTRYLPKRDPKNRKWRLNYWDPCYTAPEIVDEAAKNIIKYFDKHPDRLSYSLSVNDNTNICQCPNCRKKNKDFPEGMNSQSYYEWVNAVVKKVRKKYPDKYFGLLSYNNVALPPKNIVLDDHVVPVLCRDLVYWIDPKLRKNIDQKRIESWHKVAPTLGLWDYLMSSAYIIPRTTSRHNAKTLKYLYKNGFRFYHAELHPGPEWNNAPQVYLRFKLLSNIDLDPDKVLKEWYVACVGEKAAPYLEQYYDHWENFWTKRAIKTKWFQQDAATRPYLERKTLGYLTALKQEDLDKCEKLLAKTCKLAGTAKQKKRAKFIQDYFLFVKKKYLEPYIQYVKLSGKNSKNVSGSIIQKFDCDKDLKSWKPWQRRHCTSKFYCDPKEGYSKKGSFVLDTCNSLPGKYVFEKNMDIIYGKTYRISAMVKARNMSKTDTITLRIRFLKEKGFMGADIGNKRIYQYKDSIRGGTNGKWIKLQVCFKVPKKAWDDVRAINVSTLIYSNKMNSKVWIDDITVESL